MRDVGRGRHEGRGDPANNDFMKQQVHFVNEIWEDRIGNENTMKSLQTQPIF